MTGKEIYRVAFVEAGEGIRISSALLESDPDKYTPQGDEFEALMLELIISDVILHENSPELRERLVVLTRLKVGRLDVPASVVLHDALGVV